MSYYRLYCLDSAGKIESADWLEAQSDEDAIMQARHVGLHRSRELWDHDRVVARIDIGAPKRPH